MILSFPFVPAKERQMRGSPPGPAWHPAAWLGTAVLLAWVSLWGRGRSQGRWWGGLLTASPVPLCSPRHRHIPTPSAFTCDSSLIFRWHSHHPQSGTSVAGSKGSSLTAGSPQGTVSVRCSQDFCLEEGQPWPGLSSSVASGGRLKSMSPSWHPCHGHGLCLNPLLLSFFQFNSLFAPAPPSSQSSPLVPVRLGPCGLCQTRALPLRE